MNLLFEIGTEELPPNSVVSSVEHLAAAFAERAEEERLTHGAIETFATPRRLAIRVEGVAASTPDIEETRMGPPLRAAYDADGNPTRAAVGFAAKVGVTPEALITISTERGEYVGARLVHSGQAATALLPGILRGAAQSIPWPKPMRWGWNDDTWGRPVHWLVAMLDAEQLDVEFAGIRSTKLTQGHRFMSNRPAKIPTPKAYEAILRRLHVIPRVDERRAEVLRLAQDAAAPHRLVLDDSLLDEVTQLVEFPQCALGTFDEKYLSLPREVLISEMREHQRYFAVEDDDGRLLNRFVIIYNTAVRDPEVVVRGNERVLVARLSDGVFFLDRDRQRSLASRVDDLERVVYLKRMGSVREKVDRVVGLAAYLAAQLFPGSARDARRAALLCKADLTTAMVGEFPELQGAMGREYATADGESDAVAMAIYEHYKPRGASDAVPQTPVGIAVAIADKIDTIASCFGLGLSPTGTADPYKLRREALGIVRTIIEHSLVINLEKLTRTAVFAVSSKIKRTSDETTASVLEFFSGRVKNLLSGDFPADVIDAVLAVGVSDIVASVAKIEALTKLRSNQDFEPLAAAFKRVANILKKEEPEGDVDPNAFDSQAEVRLLDAYKTIGAEVEEGLRARAFSEASEALVRLKPPIDAFFDEVMVMHDDPSIRRNRLALLRDLKRLFEQVADISRIQVTQ